MKDNSFYTSFEKSINHRFDVIRSGKAFHAILQTISNAYGKVNGVFNWYIIDIDAIRDFFTFGNPDAIANLMSLMCRDYYDMKDGFPDLMIIKDGALKFVEIKAEGDVIRRNQLTRLRQLQQGGFDAEICRVNYQYDPNQIYVVVDVETTGGRATTNRIIELGAVKIQNHKVIDEWHSLINPQRRISQSITSLTGITNEMVKDAPRFEEVLDSFIKFMGDAVFVAHNVSFDYGFISEEYRRLDKTFRFPKLCTVAGMRRHYPGQECYKLGFLCERYGLPLERHHRALDDAKGAGHLLCMINKRREEVASIDEEKKKAA